MCNIYFNFLTFFKYVLHLESLLLRNRMIYAKIGIGNTLCSKGFKTGLQVENL